jgi:hypothetical protein
MVAPAGFDRDYTLVAKGLSKAPKEQRLFPIFQRCPRKSER